MTAHRVLRLGLPIEDVFHSVQGRVQPRLLYTAGLLPRDPAGRVTPGGAADQARVIAGQLQRLCTEVGGAWAPVVLDIYLAADRGSNVARAVNRVEVDGLLPTLASAPEPVVRVCTVERLNDPDYRLEVAAICVPEEELQSSELASETLHVLYGSPATRTGDTVYLALHEDLSDEGTGMAARYDRAMGALLATLARFGLGPKDLMQTTTYVTESIVPHLEEVGAVRRRHFPDVHAPAGTTVQVSSLSDPRSRVGIAGIAAVQEDESER